MQIDVWIESDHQICTVEYWWWHSTSAHTHTHIAWKINQIDWHNFPHILTIEIDVCVCVCDKTATAREKKRDWWLEYRLRTHARAHTYIGGIGMWREFNWIDISGGVNNTRYWKYQLYIFFLPPFSFASLFRHGISYHSIRNIVLSDKKEEEVAYASNKPKNKTQRPNLWDRITREKKMCDIFFFLFFCHRWWVGKNHPISIRFGMMNYLPFEFFAAGNTISIALSIRPKRIGSLSFVLSLALSWLTRQSEWLHNCVYFVNIFVFRLVFYFSFICSFFCVCVFWARE